MFDAIIFERLGVPAVPIITEPFRPTAEAIAGQHGFDRYRSVAVPHPITSLSDDELRARAALAAPLVEAALVTEARMTDHRRATDEGDQAWPNG